MSKLAGAPPGGVAPDRSAWPSRPGRARRARRRSCRRDGSPEPSCWRRARRGPSRSRRTRPAPRRAPASGTRRRAPAPGRRGTRPGRGPRSPPGPAWRSAIASSSSPASRAAVRQRPEREVAAAAVLVQQRECGLQATARGAEVSGHEELHAPPAAPPSRRTRSLAAQRRDPPGEQRLSALVEQAVALLPEDLERRLQVPGLKVERDGRLGRPAVGERRGAPPLQRSDRGLPALGGEPPLQEAAEQRVVAVGAAGGPANVNTPSASSRASRRPASGTPVTASASAAVIESRQQLRVRNACASGLCRA